MSDNSINLRVLWCELVGSNVFLTKVEPMSEAVWNALSSHSNKKSCEIKVPKEIDENQLKLNLRDRALISTKSDVFQKSKLFLATGFEKTFVALAASDNNHPRRLVDLGATNNSLLVIISLP